MFTICKNTDKGCLPVEFSSVDLVLSGKLYEAQRACLQTASLGFRMASEQKKGTSIFHWELPNMAKNVTSNFPKENWEILGNWEIFLSCLWSILKPEKARQRCAVPLRPSESLLEVTGAQSWRKQVAKNKTLFSTNQQGLRTNRQGQECPTCTLLIILGFLCQNLYSLKSQTQQICSNLIHCNEFNYLQIFLKQDIIEATRNVHLINPSQARLPH